MDAFTRSHWRHRACSTLADHSLAEDSMTPLPPTDHTDHSAGASIGETGSDMATADGRAMPAGRDERNPLHAMHDAHRGALITVTAHRNSRGAWIADVSISRDGRPMEIPGQSGQRGARDAGMAHRGRSVARRHRTGSLSDRPDTGRARRHAVFVAAAPRRRPIGTAPFGGNSHGTER